MSVRKVVTRRGGHSRGLMPSIKNEAAAAWESSLELSFYQFLELSPQVVRYEVQPIRESICVENEMTSYVPDVRVDLIDGTSMYFEVKPALKCKTKRVAMRLDAIRTRFAETGRQFGLITDEWLNVEPRKTNIERLMYHRRALLLDRQEKERLSNSVNVHQPKTIADLIALTGTDKAWLLLGLAIVGVDLDLPINPNAAIFLEGGHRHADFLA